MNAGHPPTRPAAAFWRADELRALLAAHDLRGVFTVLNRRGVPQQAIARWVKCSQPEISAIIHGRRVMAHDVLSRMAAGLNIPPGYLGLSWCVCPDCDPPAPAAGLLVPVQLEAG